MTLNEEKTFIYKKMEYKVSGMTVKDKKGNGCTLKTKIDGYAIGKGIPRDALKIAIDIIFNKEN